MSEGWVETTLGESCEFYNGKAHENQIDDKGKFIVVNSKFISSDGVTIKKTNDALFPLYKNDIVMVMSDVPNGKALAKCYLIEEDNKYSLNQRICAIRSKRFNTKFLYYHLNRHPYLLSFDNGENQTNLRKNDILQCPLYIPPLSEQKRIVAILDEAFEGIDRAIANTQKNLANSRELFESYLNAIFTQKGEGWTEKKLKDLINISHGYAFKGSDFAASDDEEKLIVLTPGNYSENGELYFTSKNTKRLTGGSPPDGYLFNIGDLTLVMTDLSSKMKILGKPAFIDRPNILHNQRIGRIIFRDESISPRYLFYFLRTEIFANKIKETATGTMVRHTAPQRILSNKIPIPKYFDRQLHITSKLDQVASETQRLETIYRQKLAALKELKQSILQKAFTGELTSDTPKTAKEEIAA